MMKVVIIYDQAFRVKDKLYNKLKRAYLNYKIAPIDEKRHFSKTYNDVLVEVMRESKCIGQSHGPFSYTPSEVPFTL